LLLLWVGKESRMAEVLGRVCGFVPLRLAPAALDSE